MQTHMQAHIHTHTYAHISAYRIPATIIPPPPPMRSVAIVAWLLIAVHRPEIY